MIETIKSLILDFQENHFSTGVPRRLRVETVPAKVTDSIGVRRFRKQNTR